MQHLRIQLFPSVTPLSEQPCSPCLLCFQNRETLQVQPSTLSCWKTRTLPLSKKCCVAACYRAAYRWDLPHLHRERKEKGSGEGWSPVPAEPFPGAIRMLTLLGTGQWNDTFPSGCGCQRAWTSPVHMSKGQHGCTMGLQLSGIYAKQKNLWEEMDDLSNTFHKHKCALSYFWDT